MKTISIDIETYSGTDLNKCGVYKYTEAPDFEVLLFGYAVDGGEVHVVDLALGEKIPADIAASLTDENVLKFAFNANFERVCLSRHLGMPTGEYLDPSSWRCTMVWAAYMGLPLSLQGVGTVLNLDKQKLTEGKELIKYFCSPCAPTKSNGGRTRNRPEDAPEKWSLFKSYNLRDVETEMGIQQKLTKFPVPEFVWDEYHIDQEINDRGVRLDIPLVDTAIRMDAASRQELMDDMRRITELENPNSVTQMRSWLADNGLETDTLGKKAVNEMLKTAPPGLADALVLRQKLAKSSVKKYQAMQNAVCSDGRARGMFQFYGANRTGRWAGRLIQMQNLPQNHLSDLAEARGLVRSGNYEAVKMLYEDVPDTLSQLIRTAFIPREGAMFYVADFSAIEARVIAWFAGESWRQEVFAEGKDIYCASACYNTGELPQYFVEDDHPAVVTRQIFMAVQDELKRRAKEKTQPVGSKSSFTGKIRCSCCGKNYRRKTTPYNIVWCCSTYNSKGKKYCPDSKVIPEETLKRAAAEILKTDGFSDEAFETQICTIEAHPGNLLRFIFMDGSTAEYVWKDRSRSESWTDEMKAAAGRKTKERNANHGK